MLLIISSNLKKFKKGWGNEVLEASTNRHEKLNFKKQGKPIDNNELGLLYEEGIRYAYMSLSGELEYSLFQLTNDSNYLKLAYDELINSSEHLESPEKAIFFDRPIQKGILNEYNEIFPKNS